MRTVLAFTALLLLLAGCETYATPIALHLPTLDPNAPALPTRTPLPPTVPPATRAPSPTPQPSPEPAAKYYQDQLSGLGGGAGKPGQHHPEKHHRKDL